jgi:hypothetical protein
MEYNKENKDDLAFAKCHLSRSSGIRSICSVSIAAPALHPRHLLEENQQLIIINTGLYADMRRLCVSDLSPPDR